jgi:hypothetical protein
MPLAARIVWLATGLTWAARSLVSLAEPDYWGPVTTLDYVAVWSFSLGWFLLAASVLWIGRIVPTRPILVASLVVAIGCAAAGIANGIEDGLGLKAWGTVYVAGSLVGLVGLLALAATVGRTGLHRLAVGLLLAFVAFPMGAYASVLAVAAAALVLGVYGSLAVVPGWWMTRAPKPSGPVMPL